MQDQAPSNPVGAAPAGTPANPDLLNEREAAAMLRLQIGTLRRWRCEKAHLPYLKVGGRVLYQRADIEAFLARNMRRVVVR